MHRFLSAKSNNQWRSAWFISVLAVIFLMAGDVAKAQVQGQSGLWIHGVDFKKPEHSLVFVSALSADWKAGEEPIQGFTPLVLEPNSFRVFIDTKPVGGVKSSVFQESTAGLDIVLAIDVSGSVAPYFDVVKRGVSAFVEKRRPEKDQIAILLFGSSVKSTAFGSKDKQSPFTGDIAALKAFIGEDLPKAMLSRTLLFTAVIDGVDTAVRGRLETGNLRTQKALFVFSDGHDESNQAFDLASVIKRAKENQIQISGFGLPEAATGNAHHVNLRRMADDTGGFFVAVNDLASLDKVFERLDFLIKKEHVLSFPFPTDAGDSKEHPLRIEAKYKDGTLGKDILVKAPFIPPPPPLPPDRTWLIIILSLVAIAVLIPFALGGWRWHLRKKRNA